MEYYDLVLSMEQERNDKHQKLVECLAELLCRKKQLERRDEYIRRLEVYCDGLESITPVCHGQTRPKLHVEDWECIPTDSV